jgi:hypothetical protein
MGVPHVPEQVRRAPVLALRAVFAGIGRILLSADRADVSRAESQLASGPGLEQRQRPARATPADEPGSRWRSLDQTGNVRLLPADKSGDSDIPAPVAAPAATAGTAPEQAAGMPDLPLPSYDSLSLASIRARLRGLDAGQLKVLLDYEATHAERPEVIGMFERRIEKLESGA